VSDAFGGVRIVSSPFVPLAQPTRWEMRRWRWFWRFLGRARPQPREQMFLVNGDLMVRPETFAKIIVGETRLDRKALIRT